MHMQYRAKGRLKITVTCADLSATLRTLIQKNIILYDIVYQNDLTANIVIRKKDIKHTVILLRKCGATYDVCGSDAGNKFLIMLKNRYIMLIGIITLLLLTIYIPSRIFFVEVKGNQRISALYIVQKAMENGVGFGRQRYNIRSEYIKNQMLEQIPDLDWVGVTTQGCVATIEVKEKQGTDKVPDKGFGSIISSVDGIVESVTVTRGKALCAPGQAVRAGQYLISGYIDQGLLIKAVGAEGEVFAKTFRRLEAVSPSSCIFRKQIQRTEVNYALQIGKKIINFSKHSSISPVGCVKMYSKKYMMLPGGFALPIALITEETVYWETDNLMLSENDFAWISDCATHYLCQQMLAGEIVENRFDYKAFDTFYKVICSYICKEQIGKYKYEENPLNYGENS